MIDYLELSKMLELEYDYVNNIVTEDDLEVLLIIEIDKLTKIYNKIV